MTGEISYRVGRMRVFQDDFSIIVYEVREFADHAAACNAIIADHAEKFLGGELFWTRPNWTAVSKGTPYVWSIMQMKDGKPQPRLGGLLSLR
jgi:hypothetical protein